MSWQEDFDTVRKGHRFAYFTELQSRVSAARRFLDNGDLLSSVAQDNLVKSLELSLELFRMILRPSGIVQVERVMTTLKAETEEGAR